MTLAASRRACRMACWLVGGSTCPGVAALGTAAQSPSAQTSGGLPPAAWDRLGRAPLVQGKAEVGDDRVGLDPRRPDQQTRYRSLRPVAQRHPSVDDLFEPVSEPQVHALLSRAGR